MRASPVFLRLAMLLAASGFHSAVANAADLIEVDLQLVLAADASGSMSRDEMRLQREGHIEALRDPDVINAIASGPIGRIAVTYVEWAGPRTQSVVVPWTVLTGRASVMAFTETLAAAPSRNSGSGTAVSSGLLFAAAQFDANGFRSYRRTIDISGDGVSDQGPPVAEAREAVIARRIVINGLSIASEKPNRDGPTITSSRTMIATFTPITATRSSAGRDLSSSPSTGPSRSRWRCGESSCWRSRRGPPVRALRSRRRLPTLRDGVAGSPNRHAVSRFACIGRGHSLCLNRRPLWLS